MLPSMIDYLHLGGFRLRLLTLSTLLIVASGFLRPLQNSFQQSTTSLSKQQGSSCISNHVLLGHTVPTTNNNNGANRRLAATADSSSSSSSSEQQVASSVPAAPVLDGKRVLPLKIMRAGLKGHTLAAVYALINSEYKRGSEGWDLVEHVGVTMDLDATLEEHLETLGAAKVAHVRALSFARPSTTAMDDWAKKWKDLAEEAGGNAVVVRPEDYLFDENDDDDDDDDDDDWDPEMMASASAAVGGNTNGIVSPFDPSSSSNTNDDEGAVTAQSEGGELALTRENVDRILDEVRPYLIADGGNVAVEDVDEAKGQVYLKLEGACGSCASSTITMSMGIERVLKENFSGFREVIEVQPENTGPTELTMEAVEEEFSRLYPAIIAMGGVSKIVSVDAELGVVKMEFRGSNKVRQGVELAILDVPFVNRVEFVMGNEE